MYTNTELQLLNVRVHVDSPCLQHHRAAGGWKRHRIGATQDGGQPGASAGGAGRNYVGASERGRHGCRSHRVLP